MMYTREFAKDKVEEIFWDKVGNGGGYDSAMDDVSDWLGNNQVEGVNGDDEESMTAFLKYVTSSLPSESELNGIKSKAQADADAERAAEEKREAKWRRSLLRRHPEIPYTEQEYDEAFIKWKAHGHNPGRGMSYYEFVEFFTEYLSKV